MGVMNKKILALSENHQQDKMSIDLYFVIKYLKTLNPDISINYCFQGQYLKNSQEQHTVAMRGLSKGDLKRLIFQDKLPRENQKSWEYGNANSSFHNATGIVVKVEDDYRLKNHKSRFAIYDDSLSNDDKDYLFQVQDIFVKDIEEVVFFLPGKHQQAEFRNLPKNISTWQNSLDTN